MIPVLSAEQVRQVDAYTISNEPISSIDLMERASHAFAKCFAELVERGHRIKIFCGTGNNGGDGLAVSRILKGMGYAVEVFAIGNADKTSEDFERNLDRIESLQTSVKWLETEAHFPPIDNRDILIDAIFGSGLSRPVGGLFGKLITHLNGASAKIVSIDIASGLFADQINLDGAIIQPCATISFQTPKLAFFLPGLSNHVGKWEVVDIGLDHQYVRNLETDYFQTTEEDIKSKMKPREVFMHKGQAGRLLLVVGSYGRMGAAILASRAAMRTGTGLLMVHTARCGNDILQVAIPEAMVLADKEDKMVANCDLSFNPDAIGIGPGIGTHNPTANFLYQLFDKWNRPVVLDADAINIVAENPDLLRRVPKGSILTPHPGEFNRLVGEWSDDFQKLELLRSFCRNYGLNVVLKGAYSAVCNDRGQIYFNSTGNSGMATAGSGDVLTGMVSSLLAQGYEPIVALRLGVFLHGRAGDLAKKKTGECSLIASDIVDHISEAILSLEN